MPINTNAVRFLNSIIMVVVVLNSISSILTETHNNQAKPSHHILNSVTHFSNYRSHVDNNKNTCVCRQLHKHKQERKEQTIFQSLFVAGIKLNLC